MKRFTFIFKNLFLLALLLTSVFTTQAQLLSEGFDGALWPPTGWQNVATSGSYTWGHCTGTCGTTCSGSVAAHSSPGMAYADFWNQSSGSYALISPALALQNYSNGYAIVSYWIYKNSCSYSYNCSNCDNVKIYINTAASWTSGTKTLLGTESCYISPGAGYGTAVSTPGWYQYTYTIPSSYNSANAYLIFNATTDFGYDLYLDDVVVNWVGPCSGAPTAPTLTTAALSTPLCPGNSTTISASDANVASGIVQVWQQSLTSTGPWTNVPSIGPGAGQNVNSLNLTTPQLVDTTYFRVFDSCTYTNQNSAATIVYKVPVSKYSIPYLETFNSTANNTAPNCYVFNDNNSTNFTVQSGLQTADGSSTVTAMYANDPVTNAAYGKNDFFTLPGLKLTANTLYAIRFKYARGRSNPTANTGNLYPEHLQLFVNNYQPQYVVNNVTSGYPLFDQTISFNNLADTTVYFTPLTTQGYYFSWYSNTPHPTTANTAGSVVIVDSVYVGYGTCVAPAITTQPSSTVSGCAGTPTTFSVVASGTGNNYQWQLNGSNISGANRSTYTISSTTAANAGTYVCVVTNPCGSVTSNNSVLTVYSLPTSSISPAGSATICSASGFNLTANTSASNATYQWKLNGSNIGTGSTYTPTASGKYTVVVTDANNCSQLSSNTDTINVNQSPASSITPSGSTVFCTGGSVTLFAPTGSGLIYQWYNGTTPLGVTTSTYTATTSGNYIVNVANINCSLNSAPQIVSVNTPPSANITASGPTTICQGSNVIFCAPTGTGYTYTWQLNGSPTAIASSCDTVTSPGNYSVIVAIGTCTTTSSVVTVSLNASPTAAVIPSGTVSLCVGGSTTLTASGNGTYQWLYNGSPNGNTSSTQVATAAGNYSVIVTNGIGCSAVSGNSTLNIVALPAATITPNSSAVCMGSNAILNANTGTGLTYQWLKNGTSIAGATGASYTDVPLANTSYRVVVTNSTGCFDTSSVTNITVNALPAAQITTPGNPSFCPGGNAVLTANAGASSYQWQLNGNNIPGANTNPYTATTGGNYTIYETNGAGCSAISAAKTVTANTNPTVTATASGPTTFCPGGSVTLTASTVPAPPGYTYQWLNNNVAFGQTNSSYTANNSGNYRVVVTRTATGCFDTSSSVSVSLFSAPNNVIAPAGPTTFCQGSSVVLNTAIVAGVNYQWMLNGVNISNADSPSYTATVQGSYTVNLSNSSCNSTTPGISVTVNPLPNVSITASGPTSFCSNESLTLTTISGSSYTYQWQKNGVNLTGPGATSVSYTTSSAGSYNVIVTNGNGCSASATPATNLTVYPAPSVSITASGSTVLCQGDSMHLYANAGNASGLSYQWRMNNTNIAGAISASYYVTSLGTNSMIVIARSANGCYDTSAAINVTINAKPVPVISASGTLLGTSTFTSYQWFLNGVAILGANGQTYNATQTGNYTVFVVDNNNCSGVSQVYDMNSLSVAGVNNSNNDIVKIYPNPATSVIHIESFVTVNVNIRSVEGKEVLRSKGEKDIDISNLATGVYIISISDENGLVIKTDKLIKTSL